MSSLSRIVLVFALVCGQSLLACGGSSDARESPESGDSAGQGNRDATGADPNSAGAPAAGSANTAGAASTSSDTGSPSAGSSSVPNGRKLSEIKTDAQALALCDRIKSSVSDADLQKMLQGSCAISGQTGAAAQLGTCEELQAECAAHAPVPSTTDGNCSADDIPDCDNVTVEEYVACTRATIALGIEYLSAVTCATDLESLEGPGIASACAGPFARCPEYAAAHQ